ncbi:MAG: FeoB-associated Cys-rich membrane protein [Eubacterium sp.]|nr:FeoB-associated Cys-rich membrane protein [Eubacterium sp.]
MENVIVVAVLLLLVGGAIWYIRKEKKRGVRCIGCPAAGHCTRSQCEGAHEESES